MTVVRLSGRETSVDIHVSELPEGTATITVERVAVGVRHVVRGAHKRLVAGRGAFVADWEVPLGCEVTYIVTAYGPDGAQLDDSQRELITVAAPHVPWVWISDPLEEASARRMCTGDATDTQRMWTAAVSVVAPSSGAAQRASTSPRGIDDWPLTVLTDDQEATDSFRSFVRNATALLVRPPSGVGLDPLIYGVVRQIVEAPHVRHGSALWTLSLTRTGGPGAHVLSLRWTYGDLEALGLTYRGIPDRFAAYRDLTQGPD